MKTMTNIDKAVAYIRKNPGCRSIDIERDCFLKNAAAILSPVVSAGFLNACRVERPGMRSCNEYRISATVADNQTWAEFSANHRAASKAALKTPATAFPAMRAPRVTSPAPKIVIEDKPPVDLRPGPVIVSPRAAEEVGAVGLSITADATLTMDFCGRVIVLSPAAVRELGKFMKGVETLWA